MKVVLLEDVYMFTSYRDGREEALWRTLSEQDESKTDQSEADFPKSESKILMGGRLR